MWFQRPESDRYGWFISDSSVRASLEWERFSDIEIPIPNLDEQRKYVALYKGLLNNQKVYENSLEDLQLICDTYIENLIKTENPKRLGDYIELVELRNSALKYGADDVRGVSNSKQFIPTKANNTGRDLEKFYVISPGEFVYNSRTTRMGDKVGLGYNNTEETFLTSWNNSAFRVKKDTLHLLNPTYLYMYYNRPEFDRYARYNSWGSSTELFSWDDMCDVKISIQDAAGLMGLAMYNQSAFERLLTTYLSQSDATTIAAQLGDWMDEDSFTRPYGMETNDYLKASMPMLPRDGLLRSLDGLLELPAITPELFNATDRADGVDGVLGLRDLLLAGGADYFNPATAPDILMLPMLGGANNKSILSLKKKHDWASMKKLFPSRAGFDVEYSPAYTFVFRFRSAGMTGRAMYRLAPAKTVPYQLIMWQYPDHVRG